MTSKLNSAAKRISGLQDNLTAQLITRAKLAGWPDNAANALSVSISRMSVSIDYPLELADAIEDLEYGTPTSNPKPVFRKFTSEVNEALEAEFAEWSLDYLFDSDVLP